MQNINNDSGKSNDNNTNSGTGNINAIKEQIEAATFRRLLAHLDNNKEVQNIELMNLANFCRNCLSKWYMAEANALGETVDYDAARETIYGMPHSQWKEKHQTPATPEQLKKMQQKKDMTEKL
jgi:hypothetical protein